MKLDLAAIKAIIPHRDPMLLISSVDELEPGVSIVAHFHVEPERDIFLGHFPDAPVLPGVYAVESMAQAADIMLLSTPRYAGKLPLFLGINNVRFQQKILPGSTIEIRAVLTSERIEKAIAFCTAEIYQGNELAVSGEIILAMR